MPPESDVEMAPVKGNDADHLTQNETHQGQATGALREDVHMECKATAIDSDEPSAHETTRASHQTNGNVQSQNTPPTKDNLAKTSSPRHSTPQPKHETHNIQLNNNTNAIASGQSQPTVETPDSCNDATNVGYPRLVHSQYNNPPDTMTTAANAGYPRLDNGVSNANTATQPTPASATCNATNPPTMTDPVTNISPAVKLALKDRRDCHLTQASPSQKKGMPPDKANSAPKASTHQTSGTKELLAKNTAYRQIDNGNDQSTVDDDVLFVGATVSPSHQSIDNILCRNEQSRNLLHVCKEIIAGWPNSFAHADSEHFAKLATCYLIQFPNYMCYAVTALRVLTHAPWNDDMFHGHIRELVLCAIGNGWTWTDQTATVQGRRVSAGEICAAFASYINQKAFPPGQVSDLDTAIIAVCDDLFPDHCEFFFAHFKVRCLSCYADGQVSVPLFDTMLIVNLEDDTVDLEQMIACRNPRLALDRDNIGFSHASDCVNYDQLSYDEIGGFLLFTLKITSPIEQLPPAAKTLAFLGQSFKVLSVGSNPESQDFVVTGIIIVQGESSHHFLMIERCHKGKVLIYDNLKGHKWISIEHLTVTFLVWGFVFRRQNHQTYSFQPKQYKAIAPDTLNVNQQSHGPKQSRSRQKNNLGINARKYNFPKQPKKILKNDAVETNISEEPQPELADIDQSSQHGVPMVGSAPTIPHPGATQRAGSTDSQANGHRGVPMVDQFPNDQRVATCHPLPEGITSETHPLVNSHDADNTGPTAIVPDAPIATPEPIQAEHAPSHLDDAGKAISGNQNQA